MQSKLSNTILEDRLIQSYRKIMTRPLGLIDCECWDVSERLKLPISFKSLIFFDPLFIYDPKKTVTVYYNFTDPKQNPQALIDFLENNMPWFRQKKDEFDQKCQKVRTLIKDNSKELKQIIKLNHEIWPMITVANVVGSTELFEVSDVLRKVCVQIRNESDDVLQASLTYLNNLIQETFKIKDIQNITLAEVLNNNFPNDNELSKRRKGWLYHKGNVVFNFNKYCKENKIELINPVCPKKTYENLIKGRSACKGVAKGRAKVVFKILELSNIKKGDILVTPMTTPEMIFAFKKVAAIITDEGGITCHAAIVSREMGIPCIIGTVNSTQLISDGDLIEVNADKGIIKKIK